MIKNYLKIAIRNIKRHKMYSFINILGLAIGIACCLLIMLYIQDELSYDRFHKNADRIYRINTDLKFGGSELHTPITSDMMGQLMKQDYSEVEEYTRIYPYGGRKLVKHGEVYNVELRCFHVDTTFFKVFTFPVLYGSTENALVDPRSVILTESTAKKYFGKADIVGKYIETDDNHGTLYKVSAVIKDVPSNSHFRFDFLFSMKDVKYDWGNFISMNFHTYLLLRPGADYKKVDEELVQFNDKYCLPYAKEHLGIKSREEFEKAGNSILNSLIPITKIHMYSKRTQEMSPTGNIQYIYIYSAVALFILLIACINFMNLTTARSANRTREVGIRKVLGTDKQSLISQFLTESTLTAICSVLIALIAVYFMLPSFSKLAGKDLYFSNIVSRQILFIIILLPFIVGLLAGSYPAFYLSKFNPAMIIKGKIHSNYRGSKLRSFLVVFQFATSVILIIGTIIIYRQLNYIQNTNLGYQKDQVLVINDTYALGSGIETFKNEMLQVPGVKSGTITEFLPTPSARNIEVFFKESISVAQNGLTMQRWKIDYDYLKTMGIQLAEGRNFSQDYGDNASSVILNETAVKKMGYTNPIDNYIYTRNDNNQLTKYKIIGVVKDFHYESFHQDIGPLCLLYGNSMGHVSFNINMASVANILSEAKSKWKSIAQTIPLSYQFMDESFTNMYRSDENTGTSVLTFSILSIFVACMGLFGLAAFLAEQKSKEIGVRKVLGASVLEIVMLLSKEFAWWVLLANIIAWPVAYIIMNNWLQNFAYKTEINWLVFIISGIVTLLIAFTTVSSQTIKAALTNPAKSIRYE